MSPNSAPLEHELIHDVIDTVGLSTLLIEQAVDCKNHILIISSNMRLYDSVKLPPEKVGGQFLDFPLFECCLGKNSKGH